MPKGVNDIGNRSGRKELHGKVSALVKGTDCWERGQGLGSRLALGVAVSPQLQNINSTISLSLPLPHSLFLCWS